jgi:acyl-homoserine lactone synthase
MIKVITSDNIDDNPELMERVWRFRHVQFVERLGWRELASEGGRERDRFDTDDAIHLVAEKRGEVVGYSRLLRTAAPHLLSDVYPEIMQGRDWPREKTIYEWTRCISDVDAGRFGNIQVSHLLITGVLEFCLTAGIRGMIVETHPKLVTWMLETGYEVEPLQVPQMLNGVPIVPVYIGATQAALARHHRMFGIDGSVLAIDEALTNPVTGRGVLRRLPGLAPPGEPSGAHVSEVDFGTMRQPPARNSH